MIIDNDLLILQTKVLKNSESKNDPEVIQKVTSAIESMFVQELLKAMRQSTGKGLFSNGLGEDIFSGMFDVEIARKVSEKGLGIGEIIIQSFIKSQTQGTHDSDSENPGVKKLTN